MIMSSKIVLFQGKDSLCLPMIIVITTLSVFFRYSYVDRAAANKEYRPLEPKNEPKKLIRYRDNKIVSLKGERYTEVRKDDECDLRKSKKAISP